MLCMTRCCTTPLQQTQHLLQGHLRTWDLHKACAKARRICDALDIRCVSGVRRFQCSPFTLLTVHLHVASKASL